MSVEGEQNVGGVDWDVGSGAEFSYIKKDFGALGFSSLVSASEKESQHGHKHAKGLLRDRAWNIRQV